LPPESIPLAEGAADPSAEEDLDRLILHAQEGDPEAFAGLLRRFEGRALSIALHLGASRPDAEDIVQEAFIKLFRHIGSYRGGRRFSAYFYRIVVNESRQHLSERRGAGERAMASEEALRGAEAGSDPAERLATREEIRRALLTLTAREREVIILKEMHGLSTWEISRILRLNPITVRRHAMQARERLKALLGMT
jgi:RNA polymerase sigma-70 factor (ECF subfamily)